MTRLMLLALGALLLSGCFHGEPIKTYVFANPQQCENSTVVQAFTNKRDCNVLGDFVQEMHAKTDFKLTDGSLCAIFYSANSCQRDEAGFWYPLPAGFMVYDNNKHFPVPVYYSDNLGTMITPSGFPVKSGTNEFDATEDDIMRIARYRPLFQHICFYYDEENQAEMIYNMLSDSYYKDYLIARNNACPGVEYGINTYTNNRIMKNLWL